MVLLLLYEWMDTYTGGYGVLWYCLFVLRGTRPLACKIPVTPVIPVTTAITTTTTSLLSLLHTYQGSLVSTRFQLGSHHHHHHHHHHTAMTTLCILRMKRLASRPQTWNSTIISGDVVPPSVRYESMLFLLDKAPWPLGADKVFLSTIMKEE